MGEVYRARDTALGRDVAIEVLANRVTRDAVVRARIELIFLRHASRSAFLSNLLMTPA